MKNRNVFMSIMLAFMMAISPFCFTHEVEASSVSQKEILQGLEEMRKLPLSSSHLDYQKIASEIRKFEQSPLGKEFLKLLQTSFEDPKTKALMEQYLPKGKSTLLYLLKEINSFNHYVQTHKKL